MKQGLIKTIAVSCLMVLQLSAENALAHAKDGNSSGGGTGDGAFEIQQLVASNPDLSPVEVLQKIFEDSQGRPPTLVQAGQSGGQIIYKIGEFQHGFIFRVAAGEQKAGCISCGYNFKHLVDDMGPLLGNKSLGLEIDGISYITVEMAATGLKLYFVNVGVRAEFRQYRPGIVLYRSIANSEGRCVGLGEDKKKAPFGLCTIGYDWN